MSTTNTNEPDGQLDSSPDGGYGFPTPEQELPDGVDSVESTTATDDDASLDDDAVDDADADVALNEVPDDAATNPGSPDPTIAGDDSDGTALMDNLQEEDSGSDGEPGAGRFGGTDDQLHEELSSVDPDVKNNDSTGTDESSTPAEAPSTEAPLTDENTSASEKGPFSSESDADASGEPS